MTDRPKFTYDRDPISERIAMTPREELTYRDYALIADADEHVVTALIGIGLEQDPPNIAVLSAAAATCAGILNRQRTQVAEHNPLMLILDAAIEGINRA